MQLEQKNLVVLRLVLFHTFDFLNPTDRKCVANTCLFLFRRPRFEISCELDCCPCFQEHQLAVKSLLSKSLFSFIRLDDPWNPNWHPSWSEVPWEFCGSLTTGDCLVNLGVLEGLLVQRASFLTHLHLGHRFDDQLDQLPWGLTHLTLGRSFNRNLDHLPPGLLVLKMGSDFNQPLDHLPLGLRTLWLKNQFNQPLDHLPPQLEHLSMEYSEFNFPIDQLPASLKYLDLGGATEFNHPVDHLPRKLRTLILGNSFSHPLDHLPLDLDCLVLSRALFPLDHLPARLRQLALNSFDGPLDHLPPNLKYLMLSFYSDGSLDHLPRDLKYLHLGGQFNFPVDHLPPGLCSLLCGTDFDQPLDHLPPQLRLLSLWAHFNRPLDHLPSRLTHMNLGERFNQPLDHLPDSLVHLNLRYSSSFQQEMHWFPSSLQYISFSVQFQSLLGSNLETLKHLSIVRLHQRYSLLRDEWLKEIILQSNLRLLELHRDLPYRSHTRPIRPQHLIMFSFIKNGGFLFDLKFSDIPLGEGLLDRKPLPSSTC